MRRLIVAQAEAESAKLQLDALANRRPLAAGPGICGELFRAGHTWGQSDPSGGGGRRDRKHVALLIADR
jgi:hypothetical protein